MTYLNTLGFFLELVRSSELEQRGEFLAQGNNYNVINGSLTARSYNHIT